MDTVGRVTAEDREDTGPEFTPASTAAVLAEAAGAVGIDAGGARLLRLGSNAVYRLAAPVVARISRPGHLDEVRRTVAVARWLASEDYPAVRALEVEQPVVVDGLAVSFWDAVSDDGDVYATAGEVADVLLRLHALTPPDSLELPTFEPLGSIERRIVVNDWLSDADRTFLMGRLIDARTRYSRVTFALPQGVIHGDANVGNVLHDRAGHPVVIDLDGFAIGPREWDLIQTAIFFDRFGWHTEDEYRTFAKTYGFDIMQWPGYPVLRDIRELHMVSWLVQNASGDEQTAAEAEKRISALRTGASRRDWLPY